MSTWLAALSRQWNTTPHVGSGFVMGDVPPDTQAQYERIAALVRQGRVVLLAGSGVLLVALVIGTGRGVLGLSSWLLLPGVLALALLFHAADRRLTERPPGAREVPGDLVDPLVTLQELRDDIIGYTVDVLPPVEFDGVAAAVRERVAAAIATATLVLEAEKAGDAEASARLRADLESTAGELKSAHDALVPRAGDKPVPDSLAADSASFDVTADEARHTSRLPPAQNGTG